MAALRILVAENNLVNQKLLTKILERAGHTVTIATNGREAVECCAHSQFDVALMDLQMPEMGGSEATERIRALQSHTYLPIIAVTALDVTTNAQSFAQYGMDGFVAKPINVEELLQELQRVVG